MGKYLDDTGLSYLWSKIKTYVNNAVKVTGVKGNSESSYRTGNVNLTAANIGAVATSGNESVSGNKNFTGTTTITPSSTFSAPNNTVVNANASAIIQSPIPKYLWHDLFAFCRYAVPTYYTSTDNSTWTTATVDKRHFAQIENFTIEVLTSTVTGVRWVWNSSSFSYCGASWLALGITYKNPIAKYTIQFEYSSDGSTWNTAHLSENLQYNQQPIWLKLNGLAANPYLRLTITKATTDTGKLGLSAIKLLTTRWGDQGAGSEYEYPYVWNSTPDIYPIANNTSSLGTSSYKWKNVYATTFNGSLSGTATTATNISGAAASSNTTARHIWFSDSATETKRAYSDSCTYVSSTNTISANISGNAAGLSAALDTSKGGVPAGGTAGQVLAKSSGSDYAVEWVDQSGGGGSTGTPTVLYYNATGTTGTVTLSASANNYTYMRIYFRKSSGENSCGSVDVYSPNGKRVNLTIFEPDSSALWFASRTVSISGTSITTYSSVGGQVSSSPSAGSGNEIAIYRVEAWNVIPAVYPAAVQSGSNLAVE